VRYFLSVHKAGTDRPNDRFAAAPAKRENDEDMSSCGVCSYRLETLLHSRVLPIWK